MAVPLNVAARWYQIPVLMFELTARSTTVFPEESVVLKATVVPLNQKVTSCPAPSPTGCSYVFGPSDHSTQRAIVQWASPETAKKLVILSDVPLNSRARPTFPGTSFMPVRSEERRVGKG